MTDNMKKDPDRIYLDLSYLLQDICNFLEQPLILSLEQKKKAKEIIERSKRQLQEISAYSIAIENGGYVDMTNNSAIHENFPIIENLDVCPMRKTQCPYQDFPAKKASKDILCGTIILRRKLLNLIERSTKIYAAIHENWLLMYWSNKESRPFCALDLKEYEAQELSETNLANTEVTVDKSSRKKQDLFFKVFSSSSGERKFYNFIASTHKDMLQWVVNINKCHDKAILTYKQIKEENYDLIDTSSADEGENIYNEIDTLCRIQSAAPIPKIEIYEEKPPIPEKRPINTTIPSNKPYSVDCNVNQSAEEKVPSKSSSRQNSCHSCSISEEEEDQTYYELDAVGKNVFEINEIKPIDDVFSKNFKENIEEKLKELLTYENNVSLKLPALKTTFEESELQKLPLQTCEHLPSIPERIPVKPLRNKLFKLKNIKSEIESGIKIKSKPSSPKSWHKIKKIVPNVKKNSQSKDDSCSHELTSKELKDKKVSTFKARSASTENLSEEENIKEILPKYIELEVSKDEQIKKDENSCDDLELTTPPKEKNCSPEISNSSLFKLYQGAKVIKIIRQRLSGQEARPCSLGTFSPKLKLETFQASTTTENTKDFLGSKFLSLETSLKEIAQFKIESSKQKPNDDEKPMVLLTSNLEEENTTKSKKSPVTNIKPKKNSKKT